MPGSTTTYGLPYQLAADAPDGPSLGQDLAEAVEALLLNRFAPLVDQRTSATSNITTTTLATALTVTLPAIGTYAYDALMMVTNTTGAGRPGFALGGTSVASAWRWVASVVPFAATNGLQGQGTSGTTYPGSTSGQALSGNDWNGTTGFVAVHIKGTVTVTTAGTLTFRLSQTSGSNPVSAREGSMVLVHRTA